jgi:hypothetical protein
MRSSLLHLSKADLRRLFTSIALVVAMALLLSGWTCFVGFVSCQGVSQVQIISLSPTSIPSDAHSVPLTVEGDGFTSQSRILWNGSALQTTFLDSHHLQATITQDTLDSFGGGPVAHISAGTQGGSGCPIGGNSTALDLAIN